MQLRIVHKGLIYLCLPLIAQSLFFYELFSLIGQTERSMERQTVHTNLSREIDFVIVQFCRTMAACGKPDGGGVMPVAEYRQLMNAHLAKLEANIKESSEDYRRVLFSSKRLIFAQYKLLALLQNPNGGVELDSLGRLLATQEMIKSAEAASPVIYAAWIKEEGLLEKERLKEQESRQKIKRLVLWASIFDFVLALVFIIAFIKNITQRLDLLVQNARLLPGSATLPYTVKGSDEIAFLDQALHDASDELARAAGYRRSLLEMMAHDLRNPLMAIGIAFEIMIETSRDGKIDVTEKRVKSLRQVLKQITTLLDDLLALDRMEASELQIDLDVVRAEDLVRDTCELVRAQADEKAIDLAVKVTPLAVIGDRNRLLQVLSNFVGNAIRYSPARSKVTISAEDDGRGNAVFSVTDQGPGIAADVQAKLFEKYFQVAKGSGAPGGLGYGLGLAICRLIVGKHGGEIGVRSEPGAGATFWFRLPLDEDDEDED
jgi:signal transduction histidine kinase